MSSQSRPAPHAPPAHRFGSAIAGVAALLLAGLASSALAALPEHVPGEVLLSLKRTATTHEATSVLETLGGEVVEHPLARGLVHLRGTRVTVEQAIARFGRSPFVEWIEPNYLWRAVATPNDPLFPSQWALHNTGQSGGTPGADIDAPLAWERDTGDPGVLVAVIDTGVDRAHPDLVSNLYANPGEIPGNGLDDDGNGFADDVQGWDFADGDADPSDPHGHGTHCAGILGAAGDNGVGIAGVAWRVSILPVRFLDASGVGSTSGAVDAIEYAVSMGARVLSNSWGGGPDSRALYEAIERASQRQVLFVAAAGNDGRDNGATPHYPSNYGATLANVVAVAATDDDDALAAFSNFGLAAVHLGAPGVGILSTWRGGGHERLNGTSMAAPHVSGALALAVARYPSIGAGAARSLLLARSEPVPGLAGRVASGGRLNVARLLSDPDTTAPGPVVDLTATPSSRTNAVELLWTSVGDDGSIGLVDRYEIRYAAAPRAAFDWETATRAPVVIDPLPPGAAQRAVIAGLAHGTLLTFEVRAVDEFGNFGPPSSRAEARTVDPPILVASPDTLRFAVDSGEGQILPYTLENRGASDLELDVEIDRGPPSTAPMRILVLHSGGNVNEIRSLLATQPLVERVDAWNAGVSTPTAADLRFYDAVLLVSTQPFLNRVAVGNALADYVDAGGGAIVSIGAFLGNTTIDGRFRSDGYLPFLSTPDIASNAALGARDPAHPILEGVAEVTTRIHARCDPAADARVVAWWSTGAPFIATRARSVAGLNAYFGTTGAWDFDMPIVVGNAARWVRGSGNWLTPSRSHVTLAAGASVDLDLVCGAVARVEGRYDATLRLRSNDPARPSLTAGAVLTVTGRPAFSLDPGSLADATLFVEQARIDTVTLFNPGTAPVPVRARIDDPRFTLSLADATLRAGERLPLFVAFHSDVPGRFTATLTVEPGAGLAPASIAVTRDVVDAPRLELTSLAPDVTADAGTHAVAELTFRNTGGAPLTFHLNVNGEPGEPTGPAPGSSQPSRDAAQAGARVLGRATPLPLDAPGLEDDGVPRALRIGGRGVAPGGLPPADPGDAAAAASGDAEAGDPARPGRAWLASSPSSDPAPGVEVFGGRSLLFSGTVRWRGNAYACTRDMTLHEHRLFLTTSVPTDLWFAVYEGGAAVGGFRLISVSRLPRSAIGEGWFSSGDVDVAFRAGRHYLVLTQFRQPVRYWGQGGLHPYPIPASFGALTAPVGFQWSPPATIPPDSVMDVPAPLYGPQVAYYQSLVTGLPAPWLSASPRGGVLAAGGAATVTLDADLTDAVDGTLAARIAIDSDDPLRPHVEVPVRVRVRGTPRLSLDREALDLGDVILGESRAESVAVTNSGSAALEVTSIASPHPAIAVEPATLRLAPRQGAILALRLAPAALGPIATAIELRSNDAARPLVRIPLTASVLPPPRISVGPATLAAIVPPGGAGAAEITIDNAGEGELRWGFVRGGAAPGLPPTGLRLGHDLESVRSNLAAHGDEIQRAIPARVEFQGGETGSRIDGGLFLGGNQFTTDLAIAPLPYTGGRIEPGGDWFGPGARYVTLKQPGLFLLVAELAGADAIATGGQLLTGATTVDQGAFDLERHGVRWRVLYRRAWGGPGPAVTRLVVVAGAPSVTQTPAQSPGSDEHEVTGLAGATRVTAMLFAHAPGTPPTAEQLFAVASAALDAAGLPPPWLSLDPGSGAIAPGGRGVARLTLDARGLPLGRYATPLVIASNVPGLAPITVPLSLRVVETVTGALKVSPKKLSLPKKSREVKAVLELPRAIDASALVAGSLRLAGIEPVLESVHGRRVTLRADRATLVRALPVGERVPVTLHADLADGRLLIATDTVRVKAGRDDENENDIAEPERDDEQTPHGVAAAADALLALPPNPVALPATVRFRLATAAEVHVALYDPAGRRARTLARGRWESGTHALSWDGRDEAGRRLAPGIYFLRFEAGTLRRTARWVWLRE